LRGGSMGHKVGIYSQKKTNYSKKAPYNPPFIFARALPRWVVIVLVGGIKAMKTTDTRYEAVIT